MDFEPLIERKATASKNWKAKFPRPASSKMLLMPGRCCASTVPQKNCSNPRKSSPARAANWSRTGGRYPLQSIPSLPRATIDQIFGSKRRDSAGWADAGVFI